MIQISSTTIRTARLIDRLDDALLMIAPISRCANY
jgi:hypothetical protein